MIMQEISRQSHQEENASAYQYDELNQLIRENNGVLNETILYTYDAGGNMTSRTTYDYT